MSQSYADATPGSDKLLIEHLAKRDTPCPACGHNLRDLTIGVCPECGATVELRVGSRGAESLWFRALLLAFGGPFVYNALAFAGYARFLLSLRGASTAPDVAAMAWYRGLTAAAFGGLLLLLVLSRQRRWNIAWPRWLLIAGAVVWICNLAWLCLRELGVLRM